MAQIMSKIIFVFVLAIWAVGSPAEEGMWLPHQVKNLELPAKGLLLDPDDLYKKEGGSLMNAVVNLGGGTGEFVSKEGLILTNHHVAFGAIQRASDKEHDYITNGFLAQTMQDEIPAMGYTADVLLGYEDVTAVIKKGVDFPTLEEPGSRAAGKRNEKDEKIDLPGKTIDKKELKVDMSYLQRYQILERNKKRLIAARERQGKDIRCTIEAMYSGMRYYLFTYKRIRDVRIVYAPPQDIGNYGGDIDNWMWPRHTGEFTFLRAYVSRDNTGTAYDPANVPYKPKSYLKISIQGIKEGDFTFILGYPGSTSREATLAELMFDIERMGKGIQLNKDIIGFFEKAGANDRGIQIKYARRLRGLNNGMKNYTGKLAGLKNAGIIQEKKNFEKDLMEWVGQSAARQKQYGDMLPRIERYMKKYAAYYWKNDIFDQVINARFSSTLFSQAHQVYRTVQERQKTDLARDPDYQERNMPDIKQRILLADRDFVPAVDREFLKYRLKELMKLPAENYPIALHSLLAAGSGEAIDRFVDGLYDKTILADGKKRVELIELTPAKLLKLDDPLIKLAAELENELKILRQTRKALSQEKMEVKQIYVRALLDKYHERIAPDANGTIRFTYGAVKGYEPRDAVSYSAFTTPAGIMQKETGEFPFRIPDKLKELFSRGDFGRYLDERLAAVPVCFLNSAVVTGGNSGSPVLNARGEQVGIAFDMTYESVTADYYIIPALQRTINVDIRYVIFITDRFSGAARLLKEMELQ